MSQQQESPFVSLQDYLSLLLANFCGVWPLIWQCIAAVSIVCTFFVQQTTIYTKILQCVHNMYLTMYKIYLVWKKQSNNKVVLIMVFNHVIITIKYYEDAAVMMIIKHSLTYNKEVTFTTTLRLN